VSKIVKSQIESNSQLNLWYELHHVRCVKDRQITNWKQFTTNLKFKLWYETVCQRSSNHKLKAIHNTGLPFYKSLCGVSKIVKSQIESNSQLKLLCQTNKTWCVKDRQITNWKQFTTNDSQTLFCITVCQRSSNHKLKAIHNKVPHRRCSDTGVSKIVKSQIESNSQLMCDASPAP